MWGTLSGVVGSGGGLTSQFYGGAIGLDGELRGGKVLIGAAVALSQTHFAVPSPNSSGKATDVGVEVYGSGRFGPAYALAIGYVGGASSTFNRNLYALGLDLATSVRIHSFDLAGRFETGVATRFGRLGTFTPFLSIEPTLIRLNSANDTFVGVGPGFTYRGGGVVALPTELGARFDATWKVTQGAVVGPYVRLAWKHDFLPERGVARNFAELPDQAFDMSSLPTVRDAAEIRAGAHVRLAKGISIDLTFDGETSAAHNRIGGTGSLDITW
jgi:outer membrane autotransporter protein